VAVSWNQPATAANDRIGAPAALSPPGEVEGERRVPTPGKLGGVPIGHLLLHGQPRAGHDHTRPAHERIARAVKPAGEPHAASRKHHRRDRHLRHSRGRPLEGLSGDTLAGEPVAGVAGRLTSRVLTWFACMGG